MPNTREKLIELLDGVQQYGTVCNISQMDDRYASITQVSNTEVVDHLIANGVTVQKWISVSEPPKENGIYCVIVENHKSRKVKKRTHARYKNGRWLDLYDNWENKCWHVTLWMPLPEAPKGE